MVCCTLLLSILRLKNRLIRIVFSDYLLFLCNIVHRTFKALIFRFLLLVLLDMINLTIIIVHVAQERQLVCVCHYLLLLIVAISANSLTFLRISYIVRVVGSPDTICPIFLKFRIFNVGYLFLVIVRFLTFTLNTLFCDTDANFAHIFAKFCLISRLKGKPLCHCALIFISAFKLEKGASDTRIPNQNIALKNAYFKQILNLVVLLTTITLLDFIFLG